MSKLDYVTPLMMPLFPTNSRFAIENDILKGTDISFRNDYTSVGKFIFDRLANNPEFVGQIDAVTGKEYTYRKMRERSVRCALWMRSQGLLPRDVISVCSLNGLDYMMPCFAALYLGAVFNAWEVAMDAEGLRHRINVTRPKMVFANRGSVFVVAEAIRKAGLDTQIIVFECVPGFLDFNSIISVPEIEEVETFACTQIESLNEVALISFSSGTTGPSKGVELSHGALTILMHQSEALGIPGNVCLNFSNADWVCSLEGGFMHIFSDTPRLVSPVNDSYSACAQIEKYKATWIFMVPTMINEWLKSGVANEFDLSSVTRVVYAGTPLSTPSYIALAKLLPNAQITSGYGMTESGIWFSLQTTKSKPGSCGQIMAGCQLKVVDLHTRRRLGVNQQGELLLKTPVMMKAYYNNPQATAQAFDQEGWLISGDFGYYDGDGEIFVIDRLKDIIRCWDYDVSPSEIESVIMSHPGVKDAAVVGQSRDDGDDLTMAFVVRAKNNLHEGELVTENDIINLVAAELPYSSRLRAGVKFIDHIPKTASNKIARLELRELARSAV